MPVESNIKWITLGVLGVLCVGLFFRYLESNEGSDGYMQLGPKDSGIKIQLKSGESARDFLDRVLDSTNDKQKRAMIDQIADRLQDENYTTDLGKRIIALARLKQNPFKWEPIRVTLKYDPTIEPLYYQVCSNHQFENKLLRVVVYKNEDIALTEQPKLAGSSRPCLSLNNVIMTSNKDLVNASNKGTLTKAYEVIRIPF